MALRRLRRRTRSALIWVLSLVFFLSANGQALAFLVCRDANCPMFAALESAAKSCCEGEEDSSEKSCDCCELSALPQMDKGPAKISFESNSFVISMIEAPQAIEVPQGVLEEGLRPAVYYPDHSPPDPGFAPDLGRAPPAL